MLMNDLTIEKSTTNNGGYLYNNDDPKRKEYSSSKKKINDVMSLLLIMICNHVQGFFNIHFCVRYIILIPKTVVK